MSVIGSNKEKSEQSTAKLWVVLVGVNQYEDSQITKLSYCANDCKELAKALKIATQQFQETEIIALYDGGEKSPKRSEIISSIEQFSSAKPEDTVLFYFSGHGYLDSENRPVVCVADTKLEDLTGTGLKIDILLNELRKCKAQRQLVWLDACQEQQQDNNRIRQNPTGQLLAVLKQQAEQSQNFYAMLSCDRHERSWEFPELEHGLFTYCLIEGLRGKAANPKGNIDADSLFHYVDRSSKKFIKYKINPVDKESLSKGMDMGINISKPTIPKVKRLPQNTSQTPQRIVKDSGELIIGLASTPSANKRALIIDDLSSSKADITLGRILQARGGFAVTVHNCFIKDKQKRNIQQIISSDLHKKSNKTLLLYLAGTIESTDSETYELVCDTQSVKSRTYPNTRIDLNWLAQQLQDSPAKEIIIIADILDTSGTTKSLIEILQPSQNKSLCLITATTSRPNNKKLLGQLISILESAEESENEFWVSELITQLQKWREFQATINTDLNFWFSGSTEVMEILSVEVQRSNNEVFEIDVCPYKSLEAFTQDDAYFFHGREELTAEIIKKLQSTSFLAVVGASGSGKSSVVRAGVIPQLLTEGLLDSESICQTWVMLPGDNPLTALAKTLAPDNPDFLEGVLHLGVDSLVGWLRQQPKSISVLAIDQFEELFTLTAETDRLYFLNLILGAIKQAGDRFKIIITLRSDFLNECLGMSELAPLISKSQVLVPSCRLEDKQYREIIVQPSRKVGLEVENGLVALLLEELKEGSLPLLQYALEELWQKHSRGKLTVKDYQQYIGKLGKFLSNKAYETYNNLNEAQKECAQSIFLSLVFLAKEQDDSSKDTRRRLPISDLLVDKYKNVLDSTLQALTDARLIVVSGEENNFSLVNGKENQQKSDLAVAALVEEETNNSQNKDKVTVEIAHEILLRDWEALKCWLEENREKYRLIRELNQKADEWKRDGFLLSKDALGKYEEFYVNYADELSTEVHKFVKLSIEKRDSLKQQEEARRKKELEQEKKARINAQRFVWTLLGGLVVSSGLTGLATSQWHNSRINEINSLSNTAEALLASNQELDALVTGLKAGRKIKNSFFAVDNKTEIKLMGGLQKVFERVKEFNRLEGHARTVKRVVFSPDGQTIASASEDNIVKLWNLQGQLLYTLKGHTNSVVNIVFSPDGQTIASASSDNTVKLWNLQGQLLHTFQGHTTSNDSFVLFYFVEILFSPDGKTIISASWDGTLKSWNLKGQLLHTFESTRHSIINHVTFSPDGQTIAYFSEDKTVKLRDLQGKLLRTIEINTNDFEVHYVVFSPDGQTIASVSKDKRLKLWNLQGQLLHTPEGFRYGVEYVVFSPDGQTIASVNKDKRLELWNLQGQLLYTSDTHIGPVNGAMFSPDGQTIASVGDKTLKLWDRHGKLLYTFYTFEDYTNGIFDLVFSPDGRTIASASRNSVVKLWNLQEKLIPTLDGHAKRVTGVVFNPNSQIVASISWDNTVKLWNQQGKLLHTLTDHNPDTNNIGFINSAEFSPDGQTIVFVDKDKTIQLWNWQGELFHTLENSTDSVTCITFSPDSQMIASARSSFNNDAEHTVKLWNRQGQLLHTLKGHTKYVNDVAFSPDGQTIASASADNTVKLWNLQGKLLHTLKGHTGSVKGVVFSPDGQTIASASRDKILKLWNVQGQLIHTFKGFRYGIENVVFSPDGQTIASASWDGTLKLWNRKKQSPNSLEDYTHNVDDKPTVVFSADGQTIASTSRLDTVKLWNRQGQLLHTFKNNGSVKSVVFSPDSQIIAFASEDTVKFLDRQGQLLHTFKGHTGFINSVVFSPDGQTIASASNDNTVKLWSLDLDDVMTRGCDWVRDYLTNNPNISEEDRKICDGIGNE
ncbi:nSTAND1 domain-containing NTPase [Mastigocoleus testarum]|uniref:Uncharacterized protein n=1 Tax=Mastigocoleus testarum BC008 TaxID=371196 RepID=A0A0V7ZL57_9CYAN|nr:caspase family protein [Mastigocoleus testarum]KST65217.1 hypothetical protein BC008_20685 [Mastigocoleus testarum BC008]